MIIYRHQRRTLKTADLIANLRPVRDRDSFRDLLIDFGQLECGVADALPSGHPAVDELRRIAVNLGTLFSRPAARVDLTIRAGLPEEISVGIPEGYAYYGLFPESYATAAEDFYREHTPLRSVVIGIRTIGTSLSAAVAGAIAASGGIVSSFTVRPSGHPFHRFVHLDRSIHPNAFYLIVDEGPGLSGSSFASVADALSKAGVPDQHIVFFPSWRPDPENLLSAQARDRFARHRAIVPEFDAENVSIGLGDWLDFSAGHWRNLLCRHDVPAAHPQHERRKFLRRDPPFVLAKFAGFGSRGRAAFEKSRRLHDAGFIPAPLDYKNGFIFSSFVPGLPVTHATPTLARRISDYLRHRASPTGEPIAFDALDEMITTNLSEALDVDAAPLIREMRPLIEDASASDLDGRMLPHEWIETSSGFLKTDAVDHADDHFFPGPQNIAWDIAAACVEFSLDDSFLDGFDAAARRRVPFYKLAYSAFRLGYCKMAEQAVGISEAARFRALARRYETVTRESSLLHRFVY